jgi:predicted DNA-binding protein
MGTKRVNFRLPDDLVEKADVAAEIEHKDRTEIVTEALREYLSDVEGSDRFQEAVVELYLEGDIGFDVLKGIVGRQDAEAVRRSKAILDRGEAISDDLADL